MVHRTACRIGDDAKDGRTIAVERVLLRSDNPPMRGMPREVIMEENFCRGATMCVLEEDAAVLLATARGAVIGFMYEVCLTSDDAFWSPWRPLDNSKRGILIFFER